MNDFGFDNARPAPASEASKASKAFDGIVSGMDQELVENTDEYHAEMGRQLVDWTIENMGLDGNTLSRVAGNMYADTRGDLVRGANSEMQIALANMRDGLIVDLPERGGQTDNKQEKLLAELRESGVVVLPMWVLSSSLPENVEESGGIIAEAVHRAFGSIVSGLEKKSQDGMTSSQKESLNQNKDLVKYGAVSKDMANIQFFRRVGRAARWIEASKK